MRVAVFGLGYVGTVCAGCLADVGHSVVGVDVVPSKVELVNAGRSPVLEAGLAECVQRGVGAGRLRATGDAPEAVGATEIAMVCVGTAGLPNGDHDLRYLRRVCEGIGHALRERPGDWYGIVVRSTVLPGTIEQVVIPTIEGASGLRCPRDFGVASNPEFLRESTAIDDFLHPPLTVVGAADPRMRAALERLYQPIQAPVIMTEIRTAEALKLVSNAFHAMKIVFANEIGTLCKALGVDGRAVMELFVRDRKLNVSAAYLRPGFAFGGSCLPKDVRALARLARRSETDLPLLEAVLRSNELHVRRAVRMVEESGARRVALLGLTFKPGTDDLRESPTVELAQVLLGRGYELRIYDPFLDLARLTGANKRYIDEQIPHLSKLLVSSPEAAVDDSQVVVVGYAAPEFRPALAALNGDHRVIDLAGMDGDSGTAGYEGIAW